jgi:DNA-binding beta-propeller fold protein YncE
VSHSLQYRRRRSIGGVGALLVALAACGGGSASHHGAGKAAEPATFTESAAAPVGTLTPIGTKPEGIVYDATTGLLAVAVRDPDRLLLVDASTLAVRTSVPLPGHARHLQLARPGGPVLVPVEDANVLVQVALPGGTTVTTPTRKQPHDASAADGGRIVVGDEFGGSITIIDANGKVERTVADLVQPGGVVDAGAIVAVVDVGGFTLSTYDVASGKRLGRVAAGAGPTHGILTDDRRVAVSDTRGGALLLYQLEPLKQIVRYALPGNPYGMAYDGVRNILWVTLTGRNEVVGLDLSGAQPVEIARYHTVVQPNTIAVSAGSTTLWITGTRDGVLETIAR